MWNIFGTFLPTAVLLASTKLNSPTDLTRAIRKAYTTLERPALHSVHASPTLRFSYVSPPVHSNITRTTSTTSEDAERLLTGEPTILDNDLQPDSSSKKPVALYLPGLDGYGISASTHQFGDLADAFQLWRMTVLPNDRSSFSQVVTAITDFVLTLSDQPITLIGESCGGMFAAAVAIRLASHPNLFRGLVLINPATSFDQTLWDTFVPLLTSLEDNSTSSENIDETPLTPYAVFGTMLLSTIVPDADQTRRIVDSILTMPISSRNPIKVYQAFTDTVRVTKERLDSALLEHRVSQWLVAGSTVVNARLDRIPVEVPILVVVGAEDKILPSQQEASRLKQLLPHHSVETLVVKDRGHFVLDENVNLTEAILFSKIDPFRWKQTKKAYDPIVDWKLPSDVDLYVQRQVQPLITAHSPVYFSTDSAGKRWLGMGKIPASGNRPLLFVGNHQFGALDMSMFVSDLIKERGIVVRGLAHPITFQNRPNLNFELGGRTPGILPSTNQVNAFMGTFEKYGAVLVTPRNYYRVLKSGQNALLFPGGAAEAISGNKSYPLFWPDKVDFVRTAARFNAIIVPLSAIGMLDSVKYLAGPQAVYNIPFIGERARQQNANVAAARYDQKNDDEIVGFPLALPAMPARNYFLYGKPIDTANIDPSDKEACERIYIEAKQEVRRGIDDLLRARDSDPYKSTPRRVVYERLFKKKAPTFPSSKLNTNKLLESRQSSR